MESNVGLNKEKLIKIIFNPGNTTYLTHNFHPYPGKFIPQIPRYIIERYSKEEEWIMDPFCGSGTALVEAKLLRRNAIGIDINPLAVLMSKVKTTKIPENELAVIPYWLKKVETRITAFYLKYNKNHSLLKYVNLENIAEECSFKYKIPYFPNRDHWFQKHVLHELAIIRDSILQEKFSERLRNFILLAFSSIIVPVSNQESETRYAAVKKHIPPKKAFSMFKEKLNDMIERIRKFNKVAADTLIKVYHADSRNLYFIKDNSVDLIVTSPPYPNTYDYYLYHKLRMFWLNLNWEVAKIKEIGSRLRHSSFKEDIDTYIRDMIKCFKHFHRILKPGKYFAVIVGDSIIRGKVIKADKVISEIAQHTSFEVVDKLSYSLDYVSKSFNPAFRSKNKEEHIILLRNIK